MVDDVKLVYLEYGSIPRLSGKLTPHPQKKDKLMGNSMYVKSIAVLAQVLCIVSLGPLADSREYPTLQMSKD
jgi:hypothetical protein